MKLAAGLILLTLTGLLPAQDSDSIQAERVATGLQYADGMVWAREDMESLFGIRIYLDLHVKVESDWREKASYLNALDWRTMAGRDEN